MTETPSAPSRWAVRVRRTTSRVLSAPVPVTYKLMERSGMKPDQWDAVECNEAFAAIALMWQKEFDYPMERFNPRGGREPPRGTVLEVVVLVVLVIEQAEIDHGLLHERG